MENEKVTLAAVKIMVVGPSALVCDGIRLRLRDKVKALAVFRREREALLRLAQCQFDVLVFDLQDELGLGFCERAKRISPSTYLFLYASQASVRLIRSAIDVGVDGVLQQHASFPLDHAIRLLQQEGTFIDPSLARQLITLDQFCLKPKAIELLSLVKSGRTSEQIAETLAVSVRTVQYRKQEVIQHLNVPDIQEAIHMVF